MRNKIGPYFVLNTVIGAVGLYYVTLKLQLKYNKERADKMNLKE